MDCDLPAACPADPARMQRASRHDPPQDPLAPILNPNVPKRHPLPLQISRKTVNHLPVHKGITSVNAVAPKRGRGDSNSHHLSPWSVAISRAGEGAPLR